MTDLDSVLAELTGRIRPMAKRSVVSLFWSCASALLPEFEAWAAHRNVTTASILNEALEAGYRYAVLEVEPVEARSLLQALERSTPAGDSPDHVSSTAAQDCWICADVAIRVLVDANYDAAPAIEYALEPVLVYATQELFGVSQVGSGEREAAQIREILGHPAVGLGIEFCRWATEFLSHRPSPTVEDLALLRSRAVALVPLPLK